MISAGATLCSRCNENLEAEDSDALDGPRLAACGEIICASCLVSLETNVDAEHRACQGRALCKLSAIDVSGPASIPARGSVSRLPIKVRALHNDLLDVPATEKRWALFLELSYDYSKSLHAHHHRLFLLDHNSRSHLHGAQRSRDISYTR